jgi:hypothetical protein
MFVCWLGPALTPSASEACTRLVWFSRKIPTYVVDHQEDFRYRMQTAVAFSDVIVYTVQLLITLPTYYRV